MPTFLKGRLQTVDNLNAYIDSHQDRGCEHAPSCFLCPFEDCVFVSKKLVSPYRQSRTPARNEEIVQRYEAGETAVELAIAFRLGPRHVLRIVADARRVT